MPVQHPVQIAAESDSSISQLKFMGNSTDETITLSLQIKCIMAFLRLANINGWAHHFEYIAKDGFIPSRFDVIYGDDERQCDLDYIREQMNDGLVTAQACIGVLGMRGIIDEPSADAMQLLDAAAVEDDIMAELYLIDLETDESTRSKRFEKLKAQLQKFGLAELSVFDKLCFEIIGHGLNLLILNKKSVDALRTRKAPGLKRN